MLAQASQILTSDIKSLEDVKFWILKHAVEGIDIRVRWLNFDLTFKTKEDAILWIEERQLAQVGY